MLQTKENARPVVVRSQYSPYLKLPIYDGDDNDDDDNEEEVAN